MKLKNNSKRGNNSRPDIREEAEALQRRFRDFPVPPPVVDGEVKVEIKKTPGRPVEGKTRRGNMIPVRFNDEEIAELRQLKSLLGIEEDSEAIRKAIALCIVGARSTPETD